MTGLPARYPEPWEAPFDARVLKALRPGMSILDVGAGRRPTIQPEARPPDCHYVGLDISRTELDAAPPGSYDETWVADVTQRVPELDGRFDLILSFQVLEHVKPLDTAFENFRSYLRPGGQFVGQFSGTFSFFGLASRLIPHRLTLWLLRTFTERPTDTIFPAHYHRCWDREIRRMLRPWAMVEVVPRYLGAGYLRRIPVLQGVYLLYENWAVRTGRRDLATHYLVDAAR
jgi:SAM-dependent methyltransferase